ncbi:MAG TPA: hypothetical protein VF765_11275 [Polyangiaceae bacterium]
MPLKSAAALGVRPDGVDVVLNDDGKPRTTFVSAAAPPTSADAPGTGYAVPCAVAGDHVFCPDHSGAVHRSARDGSGDRLVASSRSASHVTATVVGGTHTALSYLASRQTSEGWVSEAWIGVDDDAPVRLSEDGSGATAVTLVARGASVLAMSIDARAALTTMHARPVAFEGGHLKLGEDAVVFVGGPGDRRTAGTVMVPANGPAWGLLPIAKDATTFGLAIVRIDDPPRVDEPVVWSMYPNGLDPAPVVAAVSGATSWVARVLPRDASPGSSRVLELGVVEPSGDFTLVSTVPTSGRPGDLALVADAQGSLWLAWVDGAGSWVERLQCTAPPASASLQAHDH